MLMGFCLCLALALASQVCSCQSQGIVNVDLPLIYVYWPSYTECWLLLMMSVIYSYLVLPFNFCLCFSVSHCDHAIALQWPWDSSGNCSPCLTLWLIELIWGRDHRLPLWIEIKYFWVNFCKDFPSTQEMFSELLCPTSHSKKAFVLSCFSSVHDHSRGVHLKTQVMELDF